MIIYSAWLDSPNYPQKSPTSIHAILNLLYAENYSAVREGYVYSAHAFILGHVLHTLRLVRSSESFSLFCLLVKLQRSLENNHGVSRNWNSGTV